MEEIKRRMLRGYDLLEKAFCGEKLKSYNVSFIEYAIMKDEPKERQDFAHLAPRSGE